MALRSVRRSRCSAHLINAHKLAIKGEKEGKNVICLLEVGGVNPLSSQDSPKRPINILRLSYTKYKEKDTLCVYYIENEDTNSLHLEFLVDLDFKVYYSIA